MITKLIPNYLITCDADIDVLFVMFTKSPSGKHVSY